MDEELDLALPLHRATAQGNAAEVARLLATGANGDGCNSQVRCTLQPQGTAARVCAE